MATSTTAKGKWFIENLNDIDESKCRFTSKTTWDYNCVGFVVGDYRWWHPEERDEHYWPNGVPRNYAVDTYVKALETVHFEKCADGTPEAAFEKIAMFHQDAKFKHVSLISTAQTWKAKLGELEDLEHPSVISRLGAYGDLFCFLRRPIEYIRLPLPDHYRL